MKKENQKTRFTSYMLEKQQEKVRDLSKETRIPIAALVEEAMDDLLKKYKKED